MTKQLTVKDEQRLEDALVRRTQDALRTATAVTRTPADGRTVTDLPAVLAHAIAAGAADLKRALADAGLEYEQPQAALDYARMAAGYTRALRGWCTRPDRSTVLTRASISCQVL
jgi:hypothetical protein